jgi:ferredoxin
MGLAPLAAEKVTDADCIACGRCTESCPVEKTLVFSFGGRKMLSALAVGVMGVLLFFGAYGTAKLTGYWQTFASTSVEALKVPGEGAGNREAACRNSQGCVDQENRGRER